MLLLCVKKSSEATYADDNTPAKAGPKNVIVGEYYFSVGEIHADDGLYYFLECFPEDECFHYSLFARQSDLDETELVTEEFEEKYYVTVNSQSC
jgi:hypothetical protein